MINYCNYFLNSKNSKLTKGHIKADELYDRILKHDGSTAYCCYFDLDETLLKYEYDTGVKDKDGKTIYQYHLNGYVNNKGYKNNGKTFTQYEGICRPALNCIRFYFDDAENPAKARDVVKK